MSSLDTLSLHVEPSAAGCEPAVLSDEQRERLIESCRTIVECAVEEEWKRSAAARMAELIAGRSPEVIRRMEEARGLR